MKHFYFQNFHIYKNFTLPQCSEVFHENDKEFSMLINYHQNIFPATNHMRWRLSASFEISSSEPMLLA